MNLGIIGLPQTGKKLLFELLTGNDVTAASTDPLKPVAGFAAIRDDRFEKLVKLYTPKKTAPARIGLELLPRIENDAIKEGRIFRDIARIDAICHVVRAFTDDSVYHSSGSVNPERDIEFINAEILLHDLIFIEKRLERIAKNIKLKNDRQAEFETALLIRFREHLENGQHLRAHPVTEEEKKAVAGYPFLSRKRMLIVLNVDEAERAAGALAEKLGKKYNRLAIDIMQVSVKLESEIAALESAGERAEFMKDAGIGEPALEVLSRLAMKSLGLISFFTVGDDEVKQWLVMENSSAAEAGGAIHSDIQRGFIRAEVMKYNELAEYGSEESLKKAGKWYVMGRDYRVVDGDIISFRFNV